MLGQEVGENVNIQSILNNQSNWKGRAQQIMMLQKKVSADKEMFYEYLISHIKLHHFQMIAVCCVWYELLILIYFDDI